MPSGKSSLEISRTIGAVSIKIMEAAKAKAVMTLAHGAGAGMEHSFLEALASSLATQGVTTVRFNFPYMENKKGRPDPGPIAEKTVEVVLNKAHELYPTLPVFASGKSFGGRMSTQLLSKQCPEYVKGIILYGFPLHAPGAPGVDRAAHLTSINIPMLFLQGTRDPLADLKLLKGVLKKLPATLKAFEGADHSFKVPKKQPTPELALESSAWIDEQLSQISRA